MAVLACLRPHEVGSGLCWYYGRSILAMPSTAIQRVSLVLAKNQLPRRMAMGKTSPASRGPKTDTVQGKLGRG